MTILTIDYARYPSVLTTSAMSATAGNMAAGTYWYRIAVVDSATHESFAGPEESVVIGASEDECLVSWNQVPGVSYIVYRRPSTETWGESGTSHLITTVAVPSHLDVAAAESAGDVKAYTTNKVTSMPENVGFLTEAYEITSNDGGVVQYHGGMPGSLRLTLIEEGTATTVQTNISKLQDTRRMGVPVRFILDAQNQSWIEGYYFVETLTWSFAPGTEDVAWAPITLELIEG